MGDATTLRFTSPVFIAIFAKFLVAEPFGLVQGFNAILTVIGVILIGRPKLLFQHFNPALATNLSHTTENLFGMVDSPHLTDFLPIVGRSAETFDVDNNNQSNLIDLLLLSNTSTTDNMQQNVQTGGTWIGLSLALFASVTISISMICVKKLHRTPTPVVVFWFSFSSVLFGAASLLIFQLYRTPSLMATVLTCIAGKYNRLMIMF